ncbi:3-beta hydroxysteroid dehydrogenase/isomerase [Mycena rosella]|uniref:3-beta hydroxysteroid dehydrogenase/isomerase n=1 Tax=Mycena rosella TaxID=1033263 RepID=A0AAD7DSC2_MYCRO|nr:3-beta hydroxysteroid dehydrogenase/isomerase [Mycena rosella]
MSPESYLIVGGGTPMGEAIVKLLLYRGETHVSILDAEPLADEQAAEFGERVRVFVPDSASVQATSEALGSVTCVIYARTLSTSAMSNILHPSASSAHHSSGLQMANERYALHTIDGFRNSISAIVEAAARQVVYVGTAATVFDGTERKLLREADAPYPAKAWLAELEPALQSERLILDSNGRNGLATTVIRPAAPNRHNIQYVTLDSERRRPMPHLSICDWSLADNTFVDNAAQAALLAAERLVPTHAWHAATVGRAFFISDDAPRPMSGLVRDILAAAAQPALPKSRSLGLGTMVLMLGGRDLLNKPRRRPSA